MYTTGIMPIALINCKDNKYIFFWKTNFLDVSGNPKVPVVNQTIQLSKETIDKIPTHRRSLPIKSKPPIEKVPVVQEKKVETLKPIPEATTKLELEAASKIEIPNNDKNKDDNDIKEKPIDLPTELVIPSPSIEGETIALAKKWNPIPWHQCVKFYILLTEKCN
ncbi:hypothetical protein D9R21_00980 [Spiroplasma endosymbiont of Megaselia nigra]|nr:hypothetical protein D9R21_00980 [Spiroplasma endosymbiont of Megaselia nigra]